MDLSDECADDEATISDAEETMRSYEQMLKKNKRASTVLRFTAKIRTLAFSVNKARNKTLLEEVQDKELIDLECFGSEDYSEDFMDEMDEMVQPAQWRSMPYSRSASPVMTQEDCNCVCCLSKCFGCLHECFVCCPRCLCKCLSCLRECFGCLRECFGCCSGCLRECWGWCYCYCSFLCCELVPFCCQRCLEVSLLIAAGMILLGLASAGVILLAAICSVAPILLPLAISLWIAVWKSSLIRLENAAALAQPAACRMHRGLHGRGAEWHKGAGLFGPTRRDGPTDVLPERSRKYVDFARALRDPSLMNDMERLNLVLRNLTKNRWSLAIALVAALWQRGMESAPWLRDSTSTGAFPGSILLRGFRLSMQWELAMQMAQSPLGNDPQSLRMIAGNCHLARQWHQALAGLCSLRSAGVELTNDAILGTFTAPDDAWQGSLKFLRMLRRTALVPSSVEFSKVLSFSAQASWSYTLYFLNLARMEAVEITDWTSSACFSAFCQRFRPWKYACSLLSDFKQWAVVLQRSSFNSALGVFAKRPSLWKQVLGFAPCIDVESLDSGHLDAFRIARARRVAEAMRSRRAAKIASQQEALSVVEGLESTRPSLVDLQAALKACKDSSEWELALQISQRLVVMVKGLL
eukprot:s101_g16.t2